MKAKEWVSKFKQAGTDGLLETVKAFMDETEQLCTARGGSSGAIEGAIREQRSKYAVIQRQHAPLAIFNFDHLLSELKPRLKSQEQNWLIRTGKV